MKFLEKVFYFLELWSTIQYLCIVRICCLCCLLKVHVIFSLFYFDAIALIKISIFRSWTAPYLDSLCVAALLCLYWSCTDVFSCFLIAWLTFSRKSTVCFWDWIAVGILKPLLCLNLPNHSLHSITLISGWAFAQPILMAFQLFSIFWKPSPLLYAYEFSVVFDCWLDWIK